MSTDKLFPPPSKSDQAPEEPVQSSIGDYNKRVMAGLLAARGEPKPMLSADAAEFQPSPSHDMPRFSGISSGKGGQDQRMPGYENEGHVAGAAGPDIPTALVGDNVTGLPTDDYPREEHLPTLSGGDQINVSGREGNRITPPVFTAVKDYPDGQGVGEHPVFSPNPA